MCENIANSLWQNEQMSENDKVGNLKNNPSSEKLEISVKTFFGHELKVIANADGSYSITTKGLKGLIDKILLPIFSKELDARKAEVINSILDDAEKQIKEGKLKSSDDVLNFLGKKGINTDNLSDNDGIKFAELLDLVDANDKNKLTEEELALVKKSEKVAALEKEKAEEGFIEKMSNIIPKVYKVTSSKTGDKIKGDGNCFYGAIAKLKNGNQEGYGEIRKTISDEINKSAGLAEKSADKIDNNLLTLIQLYAWEYNELKDVEEVNENNLSGVLYQIKEHVKGEDKKNEYAGPIEAYFYAKATKKVVIIYDSNDQISVFIPDKDGSSVKVEYKDPKEIENYIKENKIDIANVVKLAYNAVGRHYEAIVPMNVKN